MRTRNILNETIKKISSYLSIDRESAKIIKGLINGKIDPGIFGAVQKWESACYNPPDHTEKVLEALNSILEGYGIEALENENNTNYLYINKGDTYDPTILYDTENDKFFLSSWGDIAEAILL